VKVARTLAVGALASGVALAACGSPSGSASRGSLKGILEFLGGPPIVVHGKVTTPRSGTAGRIFLASAAGTVVTVDVPKSGNFVVQTSPGNYEVWGGPSGWHYRGCWPTTGTVRSSGSGSSRFNEGVVNVTVNKTSHVTLVCPVI
jgi:hypothetical protein